MKTRLAVIGLALGLVAGFSAHSQAAFTTRGTQVRTAKVLTGGTAAVSFTLQIRTVGNTAVSASSVTWSGVTAGATNWKIADHVLWVNSALTTLNSGIQIYTENRRTTAPVAFPRHVPPTSVSTAPTSNSAGLLFNDGSGTTTMAPLPVAWSIKDSTKVVELADLNRGIGATDPGTGSTSGYNNKYQWLYFKDKANTAGTDYNGDGDALDAGDGAPYVDGQPYITILQQPAASDPAVGMHYGQADTEFAGSPSGIHWVYLQANFLNALPAQNYQTNKLTVEAFTE